jgi:UDP-glucuronate 4-epimerase
VSKTILVTGVAGFIGSHTAQALCERGDRVVGLDNFDAYYDPTRKRRNVAAITAEASSSGSSGTFTLVEGDLRDRELVDRLFTQQRFDGVVNLAALAGVRASIGHAREYFEVNVGGCIHLLDACVARGVPHFVQASTSSVYGDSDRVPFTEDQPCDRPLAPYPASKRSAELLGYAHHHLHGLSFTALRFFTVYGPRNRPDMMAYMLLDSVAKGHPVQLFEGGRLKRDWTYVGDIVQGLLAALDRPLGYEVINMGRGEPVLLSDFVSIIEELTGGKALLRDAEMPASDVRQTHASIEKAQRLLGYSPQTSVREGVARLCEWYRRS